MAQLTCVLRFHMACGDLVKLKLTHAKFPVPLFLVTDTAHAFVNPAPAPYAQLDSGRI